MIINSNVLNVLSKKYSQSYTGEPVGRIVGHKKDI